MLPKKKRVTKELFEMIMKKGGALSSPLFVFRYIRQNSPQYAFVAPKSVAKQAVTRNNLRRKGYSALRTLSLPLCAGIFFYKKEAKTASNTLIANDCKVILSKVKA